MVIVVERDRERYRDICLYTYICMYIYYSILYYVILHYIIVVVGLADEAIPARLREAHAHMYTCTYIYIYTVYVYICIYTHIGFPAGIIRYMAPAQG